MSIKPLFLLATVSAAALLSACGSMTPMKPMAMYSQDGLPDAVKVPAGNKVALETVGMANRAQRQEYATVADAVRRDAAGTANAFTSHVCLFILLPLVAVK